MAHDLVTELLQYSSLACFMPIWQLCANLLIPNCLRSNLSYSPLAALVLYVKNPNSMFDGAHLYAFRYGKLCFSMYISILQSNNRFLETYSVFSYSVFFAVVTILCIDSILYIYKYIYI